LTLLKPHLTKNIHL